MRLFCPFLRLLALLTVLSSGVCLAQSANNIKDLPKVVPPSPNVASLGKYGDIPISYYNGLPDISIPLYTVTSKDISLPISLNYHASGIKVAEEASQVGLGWALSASGSISRSVMGSDDFYASPYSYFNTPELPAGFISQPSAIIQPACNTTFLTSSFTIPNTYTQDAQPYDFEPDQYSFNFPGGSGKFVLNRAKQAILSKQEKVGITVLDNQANAWEIKTANGMVYRFDQYEVYNDSQGDHKSAWHLTQISSPGGEQVTFTYVTVASNYIKPVGAFSERRYVSNVTQGHQDCSGGNVSVPDQYGTVPGKQYTSVYLSQINYRNGQVKFIYDTRQDLEGDRRLTSVQVFRKLANGQAESQPFKEFLLGQDYFEGIQDQSYYPTVNSTSYITKRLRLNSVTERGTENGQTVTKNPYLFSYYQTSYLPAKTSFARDHWGYYNHRVGRTTLIPTHLPLVGSPGVINAALGLMGPERDTSPDHLKVFSLKEITYPTKGRTEFEYEAHEYDPDSSLTRDQSYLGKRAQLTRSVSIVKQFNGTIRNVVFVDTLDLSDMYVDEHGKVSPTTLQASFRFSNGCSSVTGNPNVYFELTYLNGSPYNTVSLGRTPCTSAGQLDCLECPGGYAPFSIRQGYTLRPGKYLWKAYAASNATHTSLQYFQDISATYTYVAKAMAVTNQKYGYAGGLRIRRIIDHDDVQEANNKIRRFIYNYRADRDNDGVEETYSYGKLMATPQYSYFEDHYVPGASGGEVGGGTSGATCLNTLLVRASDSQLPLNGSASGSVVGYSQVTVLEGENGENGSTTYRYDNEPDLILDYTYSVNLTPANDGSEAQIVGAPARPPAVPSVPYERNGQLRRQTVRDASGKKVQETIHSYFASSNQTAVYFAFEKRLKNHPQVGQCSPGLFFYPALQSNWVRPQATTETLYDPGDESKTRTTLTDYTYESNPVHYQVKRTTQSTDGSDKVVIVENTYPADYTGISSGFIAQMKGPAHLHAAPIETVKKVQRGSSVQVVGGTFTTYQDVDGNSGNANHWIQPVSVKRLALRAPKAGFISSLATGTAADAAYETGYDIRYDAQTANLREVQPADGIPTSYLWGYNQGQPIAEVKNAPAGQAAHTSFEYGTGEGGWTYTKSPVGGTTGNLGKTGRNYYTIATSGDDLSKSLPAGTYLLSYWSKGSSITVTGGTVTDQAPASAADNSGWILYQKKLVLAATTTVSLSGSGSLDEVRLHPLSAQMTTYTYDPLGGITSATDVANVTTHYEYDGLQRLKNVRDQDGSLLKNYFYHYKGLQP
jgi:YD repeat-containing protein